MKIIITIVIIILHQSVIQIKIMMKIKTMQFASIVINNEHWSCKHELAYYLLDLGFKDEITS